MPRWKALPEELDPQVREFTGQLRRLVDRSGLSIAALSDRTGYSKTSWERYLGGRLLAPKGAVVALAEVTGTNPVHLTTLWELAERAWSRSEMRHDMTMEAIRISQARAALGEFGPARSGGGRGAVAAPPGPVASPSAPYGAPGPAPDQQGTQHGQQYGHQPGQPHGQQQKRRKWPLVLVGVVAVLAVLGAAAYLTGFGRGAQDPVTKPSATPTTSDPKLPAGVRCSGTDCAGKDPEKMGCGGEFAQTSTSITLGTALVEVRYSKTCGAAWARITQAAPGDTVRITGPGSGAGERSLVDADNDAYTAMVPVKSAAEAKACATLTATGQQGCTT